jgi:hypothetical protein
MVCAKDTPTSDGAQSWRGPAMVVAANAPTSDGAQS